MKYLLIFFVAAVAGGAVAWWVKRNTERATCEVSTNDDQATVYQCEFEDGEQAEIKLQNRPRPELDGSEQDGRGEIK